jgi:hypothetical protein
MPTATGVGMSRSFLRRMGPGTRWLSKKGLLANYSAVGCIPPTPSRFSSSKAFQCLLRRLLESPGILRSRKNPRKRAHKMQNLAPNHPMDFPRHSNANCDRSWNVEECAACVSAKFAPVRGPKRKVCACVNSSTFQQWSQLVMECRGIFPHAGALPNRDTHTHLHTTNRWPTRARPPPQGLRTTCLQCPSCPRRVPARAR